MSKKLNIGGQAVIEGVMIRSPKYNVIAVRKNSGIKIKEERIKERKGIYKLPIVRGFFNLIDMLVIGMKAINWSANQQLGKKEKISKKEAGFSIISAIVLVFGLFFVLPYFITNLIGYYEETKPFLFNLIDGIIRIVIFLFYIVAISLIKDVRTLFQYHGAEHMSIHCYEKGKKLDVKNVKKFTTLHPRCGTSFLLIVFIVSILVFSLLPSIILLYYPNFSSLTVWLRKGILFPVRILLIPFIAG